MLLAWYYHFAAETMLGATSALSAAAAAQESSLGPDEGSWEMEDRKRVRSVDRGVPDRMIIPWVEDWRDGYGIQDVITSGIWGRCE